MHQASTRTGLALAAAAAALFLTTGCDRQSSESPAADAGTSAEATGKCIGGNACKGQSACATANSSCAGQNACKGQGWAATTRTECDKLGGQFEAA